MRITRAALALQAAVNHNHAPYHDWQHPEVHPRHLHGRVAVIHGLVLARARVDAGRIEDQDVTPEHSPATVMPHTMTGIVVRLFPNTCTGELTSFRASCWQLQPCPTPCLASV